MESLVSETFQRFPALLEPLLSANQRTVSISLWQQPVEAAISANRKASQKIHFSQSRPVEQISSISKREQAHKKRAQEEDDDKMFMRAVRSHVKYGAAALGATTALSYAHSEPRVYASGEALGRGIRLELWKAKHENVVVLDLESELIQLGMTRIRSYENAGAQFVHDANNVLRAALDLALTELPNDEEAVVTTPRGHKTEGLVFEDDVKVVGISIAKKPEVQKGLQQVLESTLPFDSKFGEILVADAGKGEFKIVTASLPDELDGHDVLLLCPDFAALEQVSKILHLLRQQGVEEEKITVVTLVTCPEAADGFCQSFGDARLVTASFDAARDKDGCIVPGIGDFEDRYAGQAATVVELPEEAESESNESDVAKKLTSWWPFGSKN